MINKLFRFLKIAPHYIKCQRCDGKGTVMQFPYYATPMPPKKEMPCENCNGTGKILVVPNNVKIIHENAL